MTIIQITDLHIDEEFEFPFDIDVRKNFLTILETLKNIQMDHLVLTGDLCYRDGDTAIYQWVKEQLDTAGFSYDIISGNHDDSVMMAESFGLGHLLQQKELYYTKMLGSRFGIFLDSSRGTHSEEQLRWLRRQLKNADGEVIVFMHHPPLKVGVPYMDNNHALQDGKQVMEIFNQHEDKVFIFSGHYHVERTIAQGNVLLQITPSCFFQIDGSVEDFKVDHHRIAYRTIETNGKGINTALHYLEGAKKP